MSADKTVNEEDPYIEGTDKNPFTMDDFLKKWNEYTVKLKKESKMSLVTIFTSEAPIMLRPYDFEVVVSNKAQDNNFRDEKPDLLNFLRVQLKNFDINIATRIDETIVSKRPYTDQEKFQHMASRNPQLIELQKSFNLDFN